MKNKLKRANYFKFKGKTLIMNDSILDNKKKKSKNKKMMN